MELLKSEQAAKDFVSKIGIQRSAKLLNLVGNRILRRQNAFTSIGQFGSEYVRIAEWERDLMFNLKMGLKFFSNETSPAAAHSRILKRIEERNALRKAKAASLQQGKCE